MVIEGVIHIMRLWYANVRAGKCNIVLKNTILAFDSLANVAICSEGSTELIAYIRRTSRL